MIFVNTATMNEWIAAGVDKQVEDWLAQNPLKWITDCVTALSTTTATVTYAQVAWALSLVTNQIQYSFMVLPEQDSDIPISLQLNSLWGRE